MHLVMMSFVHNQIEHISPFNQLGDFDIHKHIGSRVYFHDRLLERWMCDIDLDMVSESFSKKSSNAKECKDFVKRNIFIIFDKITMELENGEKRLVVYIYDGDYLTSGLHKVLIKLSERFEDSCYSINNGGSRENCQHHSLRVIRVSRHFSIINALHNPKLRFNYVSTVGGIILNRQIERKDLKKNYKDTSYQLFSFFMVLFCQSFGFNFNPSTNLTEQVDGVGCVNCESRFDVCEDSHVHCTISYDLNSVKNSNFSYQGEWIMYMYKSPIFKRGHGQGIQWLLPRGKGVIH